MPFDTIGKSIKEINEAYQNGEIKKAAVLKVFKERLNRSNGSQSWKKRYRNAITAVNEGFDIIGAAFPGQNIHRFQLSLCLKV